MERRKNNETGKVKITKQTLKHMQLNSRERNIKMEKKQKERNREIIKTERRKEELRKDNTHKLH
jgi:hypothetical protein